MRETRIDWGSAQGKLSCKRDPELLSFKNSPFSLWGFVSLSQGFKVTKPALKPIFPWFSLIFHSSMTIGFLSDRFETIAIGSFKEGRNQGHTVK